MLTNSKKKTATENVLGFAIYWITSIGKQIVWISKTNEFGISALQLFSASGLHSISNTHRSY